MRRREFIGLLGGAAVASCPRAVRAQQRGMPVVAVLSGSDRLPSAFKKGLSDSGYEDARNVKIELHAVNGRYDELPPLAQQIASRSVAVIAAMGIDAAQAAKDATSVIPIVFVFGVDPIKFGFVSSLRHPGGNITGISLYTSELHEKRIDLLHELIPRAAPIGMIINPKMPDSSLQVKTAEAAARYKGHPLVVAKASNEGELVDAFAFFSEQRVGGILAVSDSYLNSRRDQIISLAARHSIPMMYPFRADASAGGLLSYGTNIDEMYRQGGIYVARILKGDRAGELPIQQPTRLELVVNLRTANALGLKVSDVLLVRADEVIE